MVWTESMTSSVGPDLLDVGEHGAEVGLGGEEELVVDAAGAVGAQPHLGGRLLAGDVERAGAHPGGLRGHLEQQRALADAGLAGEQDRRAGHQPAAEHPVELGHAAGAERATSSTETWPIGTAGRGHRRRGRAHGRGGAASATEPQAWHSPQRPTHLAGLPAALGAAVGGPDLGGLLMGEP